MRRVCVGLVALGIVACSSGGSSDEGSVANEGPSSNGGASGSANLAGGGGVGGSAAGGGGGGGKTGGAAGVGGGAAGKAGASSGGKGGGGASGGAGGGGASGGAAGGGASGAAGASGIGGASGSGGAAGSSQAGTGGGGAAGSGGGATCTLVTDVAPVLLGTAAAAEEHVLTIEAASTSATSWGEIDNEALVLEVSVSGKVVGHIVLHQGNAPFSYAFQTGALAVGDTVSVRVSSLSAPAADKSACIGSVSLAPVSSFGAAAEGILNAPIVKWPVEKTFDDLPMVLGWSKAKKKYELFYTNENGGTVQLCGGGAKGMEAEIARWGRGCDIEGIYNYSSNPPKWERCTGVIATTSTVPRMEGAHPVLYYGDGHNRLFESRGGYGQTCGTSSDAKADGDFVGWNVQNPGNDPANDAPYTVVTRLVPIDLDAVDYASSGGRREAALAKFAPWLYRITSLEIGREGKIDEKQTYSLSEYLYAYVHANDVGGSGDQVCSFTGVSGGFKLRVTMGDGTTFSGPQMTQDYFGTGTQWKQIAIPVPGAYQASDVVGMTFDAYDNDGIYFLSLGEAFFVRPNGDDGATLDWVHTGQTDFDVYVDDDSSGCSNGVSTGGPGGTPYACVGGAYDFTP